MISNGRILRRLAVFDFDHTICELNTDVVVRDLLDQSLITPEIKSIVRSCGWIPYMQRIFRLLHQSGICKLDILSAIRSIPEVAGMKTCIAEMAKNNFHIIIVSDSNSEFIKVWSDFNEIGQYIHTTFTNPAKFNGNGALEVHPFHHQTECSLSSRNLCKGKIVDDFLDNQSVVANTEYEQIFYIGDGRNDVCPMLRLKDNGFACPREGYACYDALSNAIKQRSTSYEAKILKWTNGFHLMSLIWKEL
ncbi:pyridoxal phosphate phosphatase PHOSPHO2-like isoform X2 [Topomyia yanbarensis]|nr:pyridoxal phosphate phosphatase PHOSPHO2-like isoform X2 [Topomyia yanbarensis]XP_058821212.1 pyridoxal phosphate phosphatase PHOSPHO2-like isoform X2 [Topomyia yanbarensis]XP_058821214.1 pyridoxal phosphate phosphatase PHOSPHO2-like isoform X2 [Topomyia yanbarensis]